MAENVNEITADQLRLELVPPHASNFLGAINTNLVRNLKTNDTNSFVTPTLMDRAKAIVNKDRFIGIFYIKE